ncbi:hypothetical protein [Pandoraea anapnoica]|uniref:hypothetical protein n=1 Tax=Pandoraea anapnoica TaxID=2508301 RepID=UPI00158187DF|nr:hypothetical protein [Pandoraea anapnoica]
MNDLEDFLRSPGHEAIAQDEAAMTDQAVSEWWAAIGMVLVNRISPERTTDPNASAT